MTIDFDKMVEDAEKVKCFLCIQGVYAGGSSLEMSSMTRMSRRASQPPA
jgi:hypothetical protein